MPLEATTAGKSPKAGLLFAICISLFLYGAYFYNLVRQEYILMVQKQSALEAIKAIAVPGTAFLNNLGSLDIFKASLFYLLLMGMMLLVFMLFSLFFRSPWRRAGFLFIGVLIAAGLTLHDRVNISYPLVTCLAFASFFVLTLSHRIAFSFREIFVLLILMILISASVIYGSKNAFFVKARDRVLFDTALGNRLISFYYDYSPLASSLISHKWGIYGGLLFIDGFQAEKPVYLNKGIFVTGNKEVKGRADYVISKQGKRLLIRDKYDETGPVQSLDRNEILKAVKGMFSMKGLVRLNKIGLYFFPAGVFILCLLGVKWFTANSRIFILTSICLASLILLFIWVVSLTGNNPPQGDQLKSVNLDRDGLSIAYHLVDQKEITAPYIPSIKMMTESKSTALRYWGAHHLGVLGDPKEAKTLLALLDDPSPNVRYTAAFALYKVLKKESFRPLIVRLFSDPNWYVKCRIFSIFLKAGVIPSPA